MAKTKQTTMATEPQVECPIFLRKTYHMIDTCDPAIACWSDDGETFVVKKTEVFEKEVIPTFFKHSKFTSFVRQLNFYGFKKVKYMDTLVIDRKLEQETANYWRFKHDKFIKGKPELLSEIKRSQGQTSSSTSTVASSNVKVEDVNLKSEVSTLKKRIEDMTKNIDELTSLVQNVTLRQEEQPAAVKEQVGNKRKKVEMVKFGDIRPDEAPSGGMDLDKDLSLLDEVDKLPLPPPQVLTKRESSEPSSQLSDDDFVNQLFTTFGSDDGGLSLAESMELEPLRSPNEKDNAPDPELMKRLSDALALLPREIQEMIVNKLIASITSTACLEKNVSTAVPVATEEEDEAEASPSKIPPSPVLGATQKQPEVPLSLAAATLAAFLSHYGTTCKDKTLQKSLQKAVPIPIHA